MTSDKAYLLATRELELGTTESLDDGSLPAVTGAHRHDGLADAHARHRALRLAERTTHPSLEPGVGKHKLNCLF